MAPIRSSSATAEGTVLTSVTSEAAGREASSSALAASSTVPPQERGAKSSKTDRSKQMEVAARVPASCSREKVRRDQSRKAVELAWEMATPLGLPVEPEV